MARKRVTGQTRYVVTERDARALSEDHRQAQQRPQNTRREGSDAIDHEEFQTVFAYVCRVSEGGIPPMDEHSTGTSGDDIPGYADNCEIYRIIEQRGGMDETGTGIATVGTGPDAAEPLLRKVANLSKRVYNFSRCHQEEGTWLPIVRMPWGSWLALPPPSSCTSCPDPGWDECSRRVKGTRSICVGGQITTYETVEYDYFCHGIRVEVSDEPCPDECAAAGGFDPGDTLALNVGSAINDLDCTDCEAARAGPLTGHMVRTPSNPCVWKTATFTLCGQAGAYWEIIRGAVWSAELKVQPGNESILVYESTSAIPVLPVTLFKTFQSGDCEGPSTMTITEG